MKRALIAAAVAASFFATNLLAADVQAPLAPGKPAGVKQAQTWDWTTVGIVSGVVLVGALVGLSTGQSNHAQPVTTAVPTPTTVSTAA